MRTSTRCNRAVDKWRKRFASSVSSLLTLLLVFSFAIVGRSQSIDNINQFANGKYTEYNVLTAQGFQNGNLNEQQSHYIEGHSIPYRIVMNGLTVGQTVRVRVEFDLVNSSRYALDFVTGYQQMQPHNYINHSNEEVVNPGEGTTYSDLDPWSFKTIDLPSYLNEPGSAVAAAKTSFLGFTNINLGTATMAQKKAGAIALWGGTFDAAAPFNYTYREGNTALNSTQVLELIRGETKVAWEVTFTAGASTAILAWGGHIARKQDWGNGQTAGALTGSPYHYREIQWAINGTTTNLGAADRSLKVALSEPTCPANLCTSLVCNNICPGSTQNFAVPIESSASGYAWSLINNTAGASFNGGVPSATTSTASVTPTQAGSYTVQVILTNGSGFQTICTKTVTVVAATAVAQGGTITCTNQSINLGITGSSTGQDYSYLWSGPNSFSSTVATPSVSTGGVYTLTVTNTLGGCSATATASVSVNTTAPGATATGGTITCSVTSVQLGGSSPTGGVNFLWSGPSSFSSTAASPSVSAGGLYTLRVTDPTNGCTSTATASVSTNTTAPGATATGGTLTCSVTSVQLGGSSGTGGVSFLWSGPSSFSSSAASPSVSVGGLYTLRVTNPTNGCTSTATASVSVNTTAPGASATGGTLTCTVTSVQLGGTSPTGGVSFLWSGPSSFSSTAASPSVSTGGLYSLLVTNPANGCTSSATASVSVNTTAPGASATGGTLTCAVTSVQLGGTSPTGGVSFLWSGPSSFSSTAASPSVSAGGLYTLRVTNPSNGCTSTATASVSVNTTAPGASATGGTISCSVTSVQLGGSSGTGGVSFLWSGPSSFSSTAASPSVSVGGLYTLRVTNPANGCTSTATASVSVDSNVPGASATGGTLTCSVTSVTLGGTSPTGGVSFLWSGPSSFSSTAASPSVSVGGLYTLRVTNPANGCTSTATASVSVNTTAPGATATGGTITCSVTSVTLGGSSGTGGVSFLWSGPSSFSSTAASPSVSVGGLYTLTVTNPANGCTSSATASVSVNTTAPGATATGGTLTCAVTSVQLGGSSGTGGVSFLWSGPSSFSSTAASPNVSVGGLYTLRVTNPANGCTSTATASVSVNTTAPGASATGGTITCSVTSVQLGGTSPTGGVSFLWSGPSSFSSTAASPSVSVGGLYTLTVTNPANGCTSSATASVSVDSNVPGATATGGTLTCAVTSVQLGGSSATGGVSFLWSGPSSFSSTAASPSVSAGGLYTLRVTNPTNGCTSTATASVSVNTTAPGASATGGTLTCTVTSVQLGGTSPTGGVSFLWSGPSSFSSTAASPSVSVGGLYTLRVTNPTNGCTSSATASVSVNTTAPGASATGGTLTCTVTSVQLGGSSGTGGVSFLWSGPSSFSSTAASPSVSVGGLYTLRVTNPTNGCTSTATASVSVNTTAPGATATGGTLTCAVTSVQLGGSSGTGGVSFLWSGPSSFSSTAASPNVSVGGLYTLRVTNPANGCTSTATASVSVNTTAPGASATGGTIACGQTSVQLGGTSPTGGVAFLWSGPNGFSSTAASPNVNTGGLYTLRVTNPVNGCTSTATASVTKVIECGAPYGSYTQGYYGNTNGQSCNNGEAFNALALIKRALGVTAPAGQIPVPNPITVGINDIAHPQWHYVTIPATATAAQILNNSMPGGGTPRALWGDCTVDYVSGTTLPSCWTPGTNNMITYLTKQGRINNNLLSQTIVLTLNTRLGNSAPSGNLLDFPIKYNGGEDAFFFVQNLTNKTAGNCGTDPVPCTYQKVTLDSNVVNYLTNHGALTNITVEDLLELANKLLAGALVPGSGVPTYAEVNSVVDAFNNAFDGWKYWTGDYNLNLANPSGSLVSASVASASCGGTSNNTASLTYNGTTGAPYSYSITWDAAALLAGLTNVNYTTLLTNNVTVNLGNVASGSYTGTFTVINTNTGCTDAQSFTVNVAACIVDETLQLRGGNPATVVETPQIVKQISVTANPNPFNDVVKFTIASPVSGKAQLEVYNMMGQRVSVIYNGYLQANKNQVIEYKIGAEAQQNLIYVLNVGGERVTGKLLHVKH